MKRMISYLLAFCMCLSFLWILPAKAEAVGSGANDLYRLPDQYKQDDGTYFQETSDVGLWPSSEESCDVPKGSTPYPTNCAGQWFSEMGAVNDPAYTGKQTFPSPLLQGATANTELGGAALHSSCRFPVRGDFTGRGFTAEKLLALAKPLALVPRTLEAWVYFPENIPYQTRGGVILGNYHEANSCVLSFEIYSGGAPRLYLADEYGRVTNLLFSNVSVYNGGWNHLAIVMDETQGKAHCYLNGNPAQSLSLTALPPVPASSLAVGGDYRKGNGQYFKGQLHSVTLYEGAHSPDAIVRDMAGQGGIPLASWDLSQSADSYKDLSPYSYHIGLSDLGSSFYAGEHNTVSKSFPAVPDTVEAWISFPSDMGASTRGGVILGNYRDGAKGIFNVEIYRNGNPRMYYIDPNGAVVDKIFNKVNVYTGAWIHLAVVRDSAAKKAHCYINGTLSQSVDLDVTSFAPSSSLVVGGDCRSNNVQYFKGQIRSVAVYADARTEAEIAGDKNAMGSGDPLAYWDVRVKANSYADLSGRGYSIHRTEEGPNFQANDTYKLCKELSAMPKTLEAWICFPADMDPATRGGIILGNYPGKWNGVFNFEIGTKGQPRLYYKALDGVVTDVVFHQVNVYTGQWVHLTLVQDVAGNALRCYVDGVLAQTISKTVPSYTPVGQLCVGSDLRSGNEQYFKGRIRSVCVYGDVRTEAEIQEDRNKLGNGDPLANWNILKSADSYPDLSGNGYHINRRARWLTEKEAVTDYDFTFVAVGDTQIVARKDKENGTQNLNRVYEWILSQKASQNIQYVMGLGDITDGNTDAEWVIAQRAIHQLNGKIPYSLVRGNHDGSDKINASFNDPSVSPYSNTYEGSFDGTLNNTWRTIKAGTNEIPYLIMTLDYGPTDQVLAWAEQVVQAHPKHNVIITTHAYLFRDGTTLDSADVCPPSSSGAQHNNGDQIWEKFVKKHENIVMVLSGHDPCDNVVVNQGAGVQGNVVTQLLIDPQGVDTTTLTGAVALLHFSADGSKVSVEYYSTLQDAYYLSENQFELSVAVVEQPSEIEIPIGHSLNLQSDITVNYAVEAARLDGYEGYYMECKIPQYEGNTFVGTEVLRLTPERRGNYIYFVLEGQTAVNMNDEVEATLYMQKGGRIYHSQTDCYSIATYAYGQMEKAGTPEKLKGLCANLLRYGAKAQIFKAYRTDSLADAAMTQTHRAYLSDMEAVSFGNNNTVLNDLGSAGVAWAAKALNLSSKVSVKFIFTPGSYTGKPETLKLHLTYVGINGASKAVTVEGAELYSAERDLYAFTFDGLLAAELRTVVSAQIYEGSTPVSCTLQYSADTYGNNKTGSLGELCKALFAYSDSARDYFVG